MKAIASVISGLGKKTVAEFVEDEQTLKLVESYGIDFAQGYYIGKPLPELLDNERIFPDEPHETARNGVYHLSQHE